MRTVAVVALLAAAVRAQTADPMRAAVAAHQRGDLAGAAALYREALQKKPGLLQARLNLGAALAESGRLDDAISVLEAAPAPGRDDPALRRNLGLAYYRKGDFAAAARELQDSGIGEAPLAAMLADSYLRSGAPAKAAASAREALARHPRDPRLLYLLGAARARSGQANEALEPLESAGTAEALLLAGATALDLNQFQRARNDIEQALRLDSTIPGIWTWAGLARDRLGDEENAKAAFRKALEIDPAAFEAVFHLGAILYRERQLDEARPLLERALHLNPKSALARYAVALVQSAAGDPAPAVALLEDLARENPNWVEPHVKLATLYFRLKRPADGQREREVVERLKTERKEQKLSVPALEAP